MAALHHIAPESLLVGEGEQLLEQRLQIVFRKKEPATHL